MPDPGCCKWLMAAWVLLAGFPPAIPSTYFLLSTSRMAVSKVVIFNIEPFTIVATVKGLNDSLSGLMPGNSRNLSILANDSATIHLPNDMNMDATGVYEKYAISVKSGKDMSLLMYSVTPNLGNLIKPKNMQFFRTIFHPVTPQCSHYHVLHMMTKDTAEVIITFPSTQPSTLFTTYRSWDYYGGDALVLELLQYSTAMVESLEDLTGTIVTADVPIGMFSGCDYSSTHNTHDYRSDWVPGLADIGQQYVIMAHEELRFSYEKYVIVSPMANTTVVTYSNDTCDEMKLNKSGDIHVHVASMYSVNQIVVSNNPIVLVHLAYNMAGYHNMYYVTPVSLFHKEYIVPSFKDMALKVKIIFKNDSDNSFVVNGRPVALDVLDRHVTDDAMIGRLAGTSVFYTNTAHILQTTDPYSFGGYMWSEDNNERLFITYLGRKASRLYTVCTEEDDPLLNGCVEPFYGCQEGPANMTTTPKPANMTTAPLPKNLTFLPLPPNKTTAQLPSDMITTPQHTHPPTLPLPTNKTTAPLPSDMITTPQHTHPPTLPLPTNQTTAPLPSYMITTPQHTHPPTLPLPTNQTTAQLPSDMITMPQHTHPPTLPLPTNKTTAPLPSYMITTPQHTHPPTPGHTTTTSVPQPTTTTVESTTTHSVCPTPATRYSHQGQVICYWVMAGTVLKRKQAEDSCSNNGGQLPVIPTPEANEVVVDLISSSIENNFFLDYKVNYTTGKIKMSSGETQNWINSVNTTESIGKCVLINRTGTWTSSNCTTSPGVNGLNTNGIVCSMCDGGGASCYSHKTYCGPCSCPNYIANTVNITEQLQKDLDRLKRATVVDRRRLSSARRRKTCASDPRPSSAAMGYLGASLLTVIFGGLILLDIPLLILEFKTHILGLFP